MRSWRQPVSAGAAEAKPSVTTVEPGSTWPARKARIVSAFASATGTMRVRPKPLLPLLHADDDERLPAFLTPTAQPRLLATDAGPVDLDRPVETVAARGRTQAGRSRCSIAQAVS
jgi:hypothetical protein